MLVSKRRGRPRTHVPTQRRGSPRSLPAHASRGRERAGETLCRTVRGEGGVAARHGCLPRLCMCTADDRLCRQTFPMRPPTRLPTRLPTRDVFLFLFRGKATNLWTGAAHFPPRGGGGDQQARHCKTEHDSVGGSTDFVVRGEKKATDSLLRMRRRGAALVAAAATAFPRPPAAVACPAGAPPRAPPARRQPEHLHPLLRLLRSASSAAPAQEHCVHAAAVRAALRRRDLLGALAALDTAVDARAAPVRGDDLERVALLVEGGAGGAPAPSPAAAGAAARLQAYLTASRARPTCKTFSRLLCVAAAGNERQVAEGVLRSVRPSRAQAYLRAVAAAVRVKSRNERDGTQPGPPAAQANGLEAALGRVRQRPRPSCARLCPPGLRVAARRHADVLHPPASGRWRGIGRSLPHARARY